MSEMSYVPDRLKEAVKAAEAEGWTYDRTRKDHPRLRPPAGTLDGTGALQGPVIFGSTPSDHRGTKNSFAILKRHGIRW